MSDIRLIEQDLLEFFRSRVPESWFLTEKTDLIRAGLVGPSLHRELAGFVEDAYGVTLDAEELSSRNLRTVGCMTRLVAAKQAGETRYPSPLCRELDALDALSVLCLPDELRQS